MILTFILYYTSNSNYDLYNTPIPDLSAFDPVTIYRWFSTSQVSGVISTYVIDIPPTPLLTVLLIFAIVPAASSSETFFRTRGERNGVDEYLYIRKILYISLAVIIIATVSLYYFHDYTKNMSEVPYPLNILGYVLYYLVYSFPAVPISILLKLMLEHARNNLGFITLRLVLKS
jgi:hypothetical protein